MIGSPMLSWNPLDLSLNYQIPLAMAVTIKNLHTKYHELIEIWKEIVSSNAASSCKLVYIWFSLKLLILKARYLLINNYLYWTNRYFYQFEKAQVMRESFIYLHKTCGKALFSFKIFKGMYWPDYFVELTSSTITSSSFPVTISWGNFPRRQFS